MTTCPECGAPVPEQGTCRDNLHALLFIEAEVPGAAGDVAHFFAVASYVLQHPRTMGLTREALEGVRGQLAAVVAGESTLPEVRTTVRSLAADAGRVTRRGDETAPQWPVTSWTQTIADVLEGGPDQYRDRVAQWARSVSTDLTALTPITPE